MNWLHIAVTVDIKEQGFLPEAYFFKPKSRINFILYVSMFMTSVEECGLNIQFPTDSDASPFNVEYPPKMYSQQSYP